MKLDNNSRYIRVYHYLFFFLYIDNILWVTTNPPKILILASTVARYPIIAEISMLCDYQLSGHYLNTEV